MDMRSLQSFLGLVNFYRRFVPGAAKILRLLTDALRGSGKIKLVWIPSIEAAFNQAKQAVCDATRLSHPDPAASLSLAVDASDTHVGGVLQQWTSNGWQPLSFFSAKLSPTEARYSAFDRELLAAYLAVCHFRFLLEARTFHILTDHKPLTYALHRVSEPWSARQQRQLSYLAEFTADVRHVAGKDNVVADALSRPATEPTQATSTATASTQVSSSSGGRPLLGGNVPLPTQHHQTETSTPSVPSPVCSLGTGAEAVSQGSAIDYRRLAVSQSHSPELLEAARSSSLQVAPFQVEGETLFCDVSSGAVRPLIPVENRFPVFQQIHNISHAGARATGRMVAARFVWPRMGADIRAWVRDCQQCARAKVNRHAHTPVQPIQVPRRKFSHTHRFGGPFSDICRGIYSPTYHGGSGDQMGGGYTNLRYQCA
jgi:cleavage and polyadenylation specificity factor subunit 1